MISTSLDGRVRRAIASEVVDLGLTTSLVKPKAKNWYSQLHYFTISIKRTVLAMMVMTSSVARNFKRGVGYNFHIFFRGIFLTELISC